MSTDSHPRGFHADAEHAECRLCGGSTEERFRKLVLGKFDVGFFRCADCGSLQSDLPFWLDEAYEGSNLAAIDTGAAQRNLTNLAATFVVAKSIGAGSLIDHGGGDGLLCRLLRDYGLNAFVRDRYAINLYAPGHVAPIGMNSDLLTAFEVVEHFVNPREEMAELFRGNPTALLFSTGIFDDQSSDWWYLTPESGQHVFFYSQKALANFGASRGYLVFFSGQFILFLRRGALSPLRKAMMQLLLSRFFLRVVRAGLMIVPAKGVQIDYDYQVALAQRKQTDLNPAER